MPGFLTANKKKEDVFKTFISPFGSEGNFVKVLFIIDTEQDKEAKERTGYVDLCVGGKEKFLTLNPNDSKIVFAAPQFEIVSMPKGTKIDDYNKKNWYQEDLNAEQRDRYDEMFKAKDDKKEFEWL